MNSERQMVTLGLRVGRAVVEGPGVLFGERVRVGLGVLVRVKVGVADCAGAGDEEVFARPGDGQRSSRQEEPPSGKRPIEKPLWGEV